MTSTIPPHHSNRYVQQRYHKALQIVQHLPATSFQPTKEQKLQLYAYYKQVSLGDVNTPRPGLFDMVGRAKWDTWKKLEGMNKLEAQHRYVETLLQAVSEAYQKPASKIQAQQIIQTFALMRPTSGEDDDDDDDDDDMTDDELTTATEDDDHMIDEESSQASVDEEEKAYLFEIQQNAGRSTPTSTFRQNDIRSPVSRRPSTQSNASHRRSWHEKHQGTFLRPVSSSPVDRPTSATSHHITDTLSAGNTSSSRLTAVRTASTSIVRPSRPLAHALPRDSPLFDDHFDESVNPWAVQQPTHPPSSSLSSTSLQQRKTDSRSTTHTNMSSLQLLPSPVLGGSRRQVLQSPFHGSTTSSTVTATTSNIRYLQQQQQQQQQLQQQQHSNRRQDIQVTPTPSVQSQMSATNQIPDYAYASVVSLGPATKRALESLQAEVIALNERIDELRHELLRRDRHRSQLSPSDDKSDNGSSLGDDWDGWKWVIKAAVKHAAINLLTAIIILLILYKRGNPAAYAVVGQLSKLWYRLRNRLRVTTVVV